MKKNVDTGGFTVSPEVALMADFQQAIADFGERVGYKPGDLMAEHHAAQVAAAVYWLSLMYGPQE